MSALKNEILTDYIEKIQQRGLKLNSIIVRQGGEIIAAQHLKPVKPRILYSVSKSFTSMAIGIAIGEGRLSLNDRLLDYFPEKAEEGLKANMGELEIRHLLMMGTGQETCVVRKAGWALGPVDMDIFKLFFEEPVVYPPGTHFEYNNGATYMLSRLITRVTGESLLDYADKRIFQPLEIEKPQWDTCRRGYTQGFSGLHLTCEELSRFGQLVLDRGSYRGRQLIPAEYIDEASKKQIDNSDYNPETSPIEQRQGYGYQLWRNTYPNSFRMDGANGQFVVMLPEKNAVITIVSEEVQNMFAILKYVWTRLVDKL